MTISQAIKQLEKLREVVGEVQVCADCPFCGRSFETGVVVAGPPVVVLKTAEKP